MNLRGVGAIALTVCLAACTPGGPAPVPPPAPTASAEPAPSYLDGAAMPARTALRLIFGGGAEVDVDAERDRSVAGDHLAAAARPTAPAARGAADRRRFRPRSGRTYAKRLPGPDGGTADRTGSAFVAASADGKGVWLAEYHEAPGARCARWGWTGATAGRPGPWSAAPSRSPRPRTGCGSTSARTRSSRRRWARRRVSTGRRCWIRPRSRSSASYAGGRADRRGPGDRPGGVLGAARPAYRPGHADRPAAGARLAGPAGGCGQRRRPATCRSHSASRATHRRSWTCGCSTSRRRGGPICR